MGMATCYAAARQGPGRVGVPWAHRGGGGGRKPGGCGAGRSHLRGALPRSAVANRMPSADAGGKKSGGTP